VFHQTAPSYGGMKTEQKYSELTVFVFYIMIPFSNMKNCQFQLVSQPFSTIFLYSLIAKYRNILNRPLSFFYIVISFSTVSDRFHPYSYVPLLAAT
jgi:hypothetical protein